MTPFLILLTPFAVFVHHHRYGFMRPEIAIALLTFAGIALLLGAAARRSHRVEIVVMAALLTLFADIQLQNPGAKQILLLFAALCAVLWPLREHAPRIVSLMMATMLATSLLPLGGVAASHSSLPGRDASDPNAAARAELPLIVHLVLDEHIGVEGLPDALTPGTFKEEIRAFFVERGFRLFGAAYSEHPATLPSLSHLLNLVHGRYVPGLTAPAPVQNRYQLTQNVYFERLERAGYAIRAHHIDYLDVCAGQCSSVEMPIGRRNRCLRRCTMPRRLPSRSSRCLPQCSWRGRNVITRLKWGGPITPAWVGSSAGVHLPDRNWNRVRVSPMGSMAALDLIAADVARSQRGELFFAHLLLPHHPYIYDAECHVRPPGEWLHPQPREDDEVKGASGTSTPPLVARSGIRSISSRFAAPTGRSIRYSTPFHRRSGTMRSSSSTAIMGRASAWSRRRAGATTRSAEPTTRISSLRCSPFGQDRSRLDTTANRLRSRACFADVG